MQFTVDTFGDKGADSLLVQMIDRQEPEENIGWEISWIRKFTGGRNFALRTVKVNSWNEDLSPWKAPAVFGKEDFGEGAGQTLEFLLREVISEQEKKEKTIFLGGYSLAGLFALWAGCRTDCFRGIAAASPSVWFSGFTDFLQANPMRADAVYLSLGDREEKTRNPVMAQVGNAIRNVHGILCSSGTACVLEWNKGNHFTEPDLRTAKAFAWLLKRG